MSDTTNYEFEWEEAKAEANLAKHGVDFMEAMTVFADALLMTRYDDEHSDEEERWVSLGQSAAGRLLVVVHTFASISPATALIRVISARSPTRRERGQYEQER